MSEQHERRIRALEAAQANSRSAGRPLYDTGTWTPALAGTTIAGTFTYATQSGVWRRIGDLVVVLGDVAISAISVAPTGNMTITGLPVTVASIVTAFWIGTISNLDYPAGALEIGMQAVNGGTVISLIYSRDNQAVLAYPAASFTNTDALLRFGGAYLAA